jgi:hypothetical protein
MPFSHQAQFKLFPASNVYPSRPKAPAASFVVLATLAAAMLSAPTPAHAQSNCAPGTAQLNHDRDLARDCASGLCVERACVNTLYRSATLCGHGFFGAPSVLIGGQSLPVLPSAPGLCGAMDESLVVGLVEAAEGQHNMVVLNGAMKSEPFFIKVGELAGPQGPMGATGAQGPKGDTGPQGAAGAQGTAGAAGAQGPKGDTGPQGAIGAQGPAGAAGAQGPKGDTGPQGAIGAQGLAGAAGAQGPKGDTGLNGAQGAKGDKGDTGPQGPAGLNGTNGATGPQGPAGSSGTSNLAISAGVYTIGPYCAGTGVLTLDSLCHYPAATTTTGLQGLVRSPADAAICPSVGGVNNYSYRFVYTPPTCAATCAAGAQTARSACMVYCIIPAGQGGSGFSSEGCGQSGTVYDVTCDCDNTLLGYLVK